MIDDLVILIEKIKSNPSVSSYNEDQTKNGIILPVLRRLGWDTENIDEVFPEFSIENQRVDYALRLKNKQIVFLEAKRPIEDLDNEGHQDQLLKYSYRVSVELAVLTNGITWYLYLPTAGVDWKSRKFYTVDLKAQESASVANKLIELLSRENVESGKALDTAKAIHQDKMKEGAIGEAIPIAWNKIIEEPDSLLLELLAENTEKICGHRPETSILIKFIKSHNFLIVTNILNQKTISEMRKSASVSTRQVNSDTKLHKPRGQKLYEHLEDYLIPVIKLMQDGYSHTEAFHQVANKLNVLYGTVSSQCSRGLNISVDEFVQFVKLGRIKQVLKNKFPNRAHLIEREI